MSTLMQQQVACNATHSLVTFYATLSNTELKLKELGNWVKKHREKMNYSQESAAKKSGLSRYQWIRIENGQSGTKRETIIRIAKELEADGTEGLTLLAGLENESSKVLPEELQIMDYDGFDKDDLKDIAEYISFKRMQKEKLEREGK